MITKYILLAIQMSDSPIERENTNEFNGFFIIPEIPKIPKIPKTLLIAINEACTAYQEYHKNRELPEYNRGYPSGFFSFARHLGSGIMHAELFKETIKIIDPFNPNSTEIRLITKLEHFLNDQDTHFNTHSLSTYLMDAIIEQKILQITPNEKTGCYSLEDRDIVVQAINADKPQPIERNYWQR